MSVDREYRIRISTVADGTAAANTAQDLKGVGKAGEEAGEGIKIFETHGREMHKLIHELDQILPGAGIALKAAFNPATLGLGATVLIIEQVKSALEEYNKKLDEIGEAAAKADLASGIQAALEVSRAAVEEQEKYLHNLQEIQRGEHGVAVEMNNQLQLIAAIAAARQAHAEADKTLALAKLKEQEVMGTITPSQAIIQKGQIEEKYVREKRAAEERKFQEEQDARNLATDEAHYKQSDLDSKQAAAAEALEKAKAQKEKDKAANPEDDAIKKAIADADAADEKRKAANNLLHQVNAEDRPEFQQKLKDAEDEAAAARAQLNNLNNRRKAAKDAEGRDLSPLEIAAADATKAAQDNAKSEAAARDKANQAQREHDQAAGDKAGADTSSIGATQSNVRTELAQRAAALQKEFQNQGPAISHQDAAELLQLMRTVGEHFFEQGQNSVTKKQFQQELTALRRLIETKK